MVQFGDRVELDDAIGEGELVGLAEDEVGAEGFELVLGRGFEQAAGEGDGGVGRDAAGEAHEVARLLVGDVGDGAGVDDDGVGVSVARSTTFQPASRRRRAIASESAMLSLQPRVRMAAVAGRALSDISDPSKRS